MDPPPGMVVDHIDGNQLNNSRSNLRICTQGNNAKNRRGAANVVERHGRWRAGITHNQVCMWFGTYDTKEEAQAVVDAKKRELFGEFAPQQEIK